jgi:hypothetical protein
MVAARVSSRNANEKTLRHNFLCLSNCAARKLDFWCNWRWVLHRADSENPFDIALCDIRVVQNPGSIAPGCMFLAREFYPSEGYCRGFPLDGAGRSERFAPAHCASGRNWITMRADGRSSFQRALRHGEGRHATC